MEELVPEDLGIVADLRLIPEHLIDCNCESRLLRIGCKISVVESRAPHKEIVKELAATVVIEERPEGRLHHAIKSVTVYGNCDCRLAARLYRSWLIKDTVGE